MLAAGVAAELAKSSANRWLGVALPPHHCSKQLHLVGCMQAICKSSAYICQCMQDP